ncbi:hypothetical protein Q1695_012404 [Nippostrongylus brasiliensis]|nr:hypothetical protein Q1695_012404 [Nippostrongylus brasiliensis]
MVAFHFVIFILTFVYVVCSPCLKFLRKKTDLSHSKKSPSGSKTVKGRGRYAPITKRQTQSISRSQISTSVQNATTTATTTRKKMSASSASMETSESQETKGTNETLPLEKTQPAGSSEYDDEEPKEQLGDVILVKPKTDKEKNIEMILKNRLMIEKKLSEEDSETIKSIDDTLRGVESLKTDNLTSLAVHSPTAASKRHLKNTKMISETVK